MATEYKLSYTAAEIDERLNNVIQNSENIGTLQTDMGTLQTDVGTVRTDVGTLQTDVGTLQTDVEIKTEIVTLTSAEYEALGDNFNANFIYNLSDEEETFSYNDLTDKPEIPSIEGLATEEYVNAQISAIPAPDVSGQISAHNTATDAHNDIRLLVEGLTTRLNTLADSDDTTLDQMSEVVAYIKSNKELIEAVTTSKVNVSDIIDNLITNVANKPLSAAQGVALKALIDAITVPTKVSELTNDAGYLTEHQSLAGYAKTADIPTKVSELTNDKNYLTSYTETDPTVPAWAKASTKPTYTASEVGAMPKVVVTTSDNGKFLRVVNGAWAAASIPNAEEASF